MTCCGYVKIFGRCDLADIQKERLCARVSNPALLRRHHPNKTTHLRLNSRHLSLNKGLAHGLELREIALVC